MSRQVETLIAACFYYSGLVKLACWWKQRSSGKKLIILGYHCAFGGDFYRVAGGRLRHHLLYLNTHYRILHLETALEELYIPNKSELQKREKRTPLALTFDDGYHDNYTHAFMLACELQVPMTIFLVPGYIDSGTRFWWQEVDQLVTHTQVREVRLEGHTFRLDRLDERKALIQAINTHICHTTSLTEREEFLASLRQLLADLSVAAEEQGALPLTWAEVKEMEEYKWISFGAHTMHHPVLANLTDPVEIQREVSECRVVLERQLGHAIRTFAYPHGLPEHIGENGLGAVRASGYDWAVTTIDGFNTPQTDPHLQHRLVVDVSQHWLVVAAKASGVWGFFTHLYQIPMAFLGSVLQAIHWGATRLLGSLSSR